MIFNIDKNTLTEEEKTAFGRRIDNALQMMDSATKDDRDYLLFVEYLSRRGLQFAEFDVDQSYYKSTSCVMTIHDDSTHVLGWYKVEADPSSFVHFNLIQCICELSAHMMSEPASVFEFLPRLALKHVQNLSLSYMRHELVNEIMDVQADLMTYLVSRPELLTGDLLQSFATYKKSLESE